MPSGRPRRFKVPKIPEYSVSRLSVYYRCLKRLRRENLETVSSEKLAKRFGLNAAQIRKDLAYFGDFGVRGVGYRVRDLTRHLQEILGLNRSWPVALLGLGNLGQALLRYQGFEESGFRIVVGFDRDPYRLQGIDAVETEFRHVDDLESVLSDSNIEIAIVAIPGESAQEITDRLVAVGIRGILNFTPVTLSVPDHVNLRDVDLTFALENLAFYLTRRSEDEANEETTRAEIP